MTSGLQGKVAVVTGEVVSVDGGSSIVSAVRPSGGAGAWDFGALDERTYGLGGAGKEWAMRQVGFVGLGNMGGRMTRRLVAAGFRVVGYDARAGQAASAGAVAAEALGEVCAGTEVVLLSLPDSRAVESVVLGARPESDGLLAFARPGQVIIDLSTSAPSSTQRIHAVLAERGVEYLDAGISGGAAAAESG